MQSGKLVDGLLGSVQLFVLQLQIGQNGPCFWKFRRLGRDGLDLLFGVGKALLPDQQPGKAHPKLGRRILVQITLNQRLNFGGPRLQQLHGQQGNGAGARVELFSVLQGLQRGRLLVCYQAQMADGGPGHGAVLRVFQAAVQRLLDHIGGQRFIGGIAIQLGNAKEACAALFGGRQLHLAAQIGG